MNDNIIMCKEKDIIKPSACSATSGKYKRGGAWMTSDPIEYNLLKENAKQNRKNMTDAESALWQYAKSSGLGEKCRRQYIIGDYIVDFFFRESMLVIELDGGYHFTPEQTQLDHTRQQWLESIGYKVLRFTNEELLVNTDAVINNIKSHLKSK